MSYDGTPYVVLLNGETYYLSCENKWERLPGCATDIGVGRGNEVFKTGCDPREGGFDVYKLQCNCKCEVGSEAFGRCKRYNKSYKEIAKTKNDEKKCFWLRLEDAGVRIDVSTSGLPYVTRSCGRIYYYNGLNWNHVGALLALDISISNEGNLFAVGTDNKLYKAKHDDTFTLIEEVEYAKAVTVGPFNLPFTIGHDDSVLFSAKSDFN